MSISKNVVQNIKYLENYEFGALPKISSLTSNRGISPVNDRNLFAKYCLLTDGDGNLNLFSKGQYAYWTNAVDRVTLFRQLLHKNHLIIDLKPLKNNDEFKQTYGFSVQQLLRLAADKRVTLNLYAYESNKNINFQEYTHFKGTRDEEIAYQNLFLPENNTRINSIRRGYLFDSSLKESSISYSELIEEGKERFSELLNNQEIVSELFNKKLIRSTSQHGTIHQLSQQYAEVKSLLLLSNDDKGLMLMKEVYNKKNYSEKSIATLRALRILVSSSFSASLGGHYTMSYSSVNSIQLANRYLVGNSAKLFSKYEQQNFSADYNTEKRSARNIIMDFLIQSTLNHFDLNDVPEHIDEKLFERYSSYLYDNEELIGRQAKFIDDLVKDKYLSDRNLDLLEKYLKIQKDLSISLEGFKKRHSIVWKTMVAAVIFYAVVQPNEKSIIALITTLAPDLLKDTLDDKFAKLISGHKAQAMLDAKEVKEWLKANQKLR